MNKQAILKRIDVVDFVREHLKKDWSGNEKDLINCPMSDRHEGGADDTASLSIDPATGKFNCFGCGWKGTSVIGLYADIVGNYKKAIRELHHIYVGPTIDEKKVAAYHKKLLSMPNLLTKLLANRGWSKKVIKKFKLGWDSTKKRVTIPIYNDCDIAVDLKFHDSLHLAPKNNKGKRITMLSMQGAINGRWFPCGSKFDPFGEDKKEIWIVEGEPDAILAHALGLNAITKTGGVNQLSSLSYDDIALFRGKHVILCLDSDTPGQAAALDIANRLAAVEVGSIKNIVLPQGKDITDFICRYSHDAEDLANLVASTHYVLKPKRKAKELIPLSETSKAEYIGQFIKTRVLVSGKHHAPQAIPLRLEVVCTNADRCDNCICGNRSSTEYFVHTDDPAFLEWLYVKDWSTQIKKEAGLPKVCKMNIEVLDWQNIEQLTLIPALTHSRRKDEGAYVTRNGFFVGHNLETNQTYEVEAIPAVHPRTKESVIIVKKAIGTYDSLSSFKLTKKEVAYIKKFFKDPPAKIIKDICEILSTNHTHIYGRWDLHALVDLTFHSPRDLVFARTRLPKGSMEVLILGDTRCGKGQVAEGLIKFYDLGEVVSGENASFMGLCGGLAKVGDNFRLSWGAIPLNHGRLVVIDEFTGLQGDILGRLSRIRSEGIAEINKGGISTKTRANTRLIWIANPRKGVELAHFSSGVTAIMDLLGTNEDVARFDLAMVVQKGEVDIENINVIHLDIPSDKYPRDILRQVVLWTWSRTEDQIIFTQQAVEYILRASIRLSKKYSPTIPLVQGENIRFKLAKLAAAIACRTFSTKDGVTVTVSSEHAKLAVSLMQYYYDKPVMGYKHFSEIEIGARQLVDKKTLKQFFEQWPEPRRKLIIEGLLSLDRFGVRELMDWCDVDGALAKKFAGTFISCQATKLVKGGYYMKKPAFIKFLKKMKNRLHK